MYIQLKHLLLDIYTIIHVDLKRWCAAGVAILFIILKVAITEECVCYK